MALTRRAARRKRRRKGTQMTVGHMRSLQVGDEVVEDL
jgi:hypothetical protein